MNQMHLSANASGTDANATKYMANPLEESARLFKVLLTPNISVSTHASNYMTFDIKKGSTVLATFTTNSSGGAALTAGTPVELTITGSGKDVEVASDGAFTLLCTKAGTGPAYDVTATLAVQGIRQ